MGNERDDQKRTFKKGSRKSKAQKTHRCARRNLAQKEAYILGNIRFQIIATIVTTRTAPAPTTTTGAHKPWSLVKRVRGCGQTVFGVEHNKKNTRRSSRQAERNKHKIKVSRDSSPGMEYTALRWKLEKQSFHKPDAEWNWRT